MNVNVALRGGKKVEAKEASFALSNHAFSSSVSAFSSAFRRVQPLSYRTLQTLTPTQPPPSNFVCDTFCKMAAPPGLAHVGNSDIVTVDRGYLNALVRR
jgi:hypothetical protein